MLSDCPTCGGGVTRAACVCDEAAPPKPEVCEAYGAIGAEPLELLWSKPRPEGGVRYGTELCPICGDHFESNDKLQAEVERLRKIYDADYLAQVVKERDEWIVAYRAERAAVGRLVQERDALAAQVARLERALAYAKVQIDNGVDHELAYLHLAEIERVIKGEV